MRVTVAEKGEVGGGSESLTRLANSYFVKSKLRI